MEDPPTENPSITLDSSKVSSVLNGAVGENHHRESQPLSQEQRDAIKARLLERQRAARSSSNSRITSNSNSNSSSSNTKESAFTVAASPEKGGRETNLTADSPPALPPRTHQNSQFQQHQQQTDQLINNMIPKVSPHPSLHPPSASASVKLLAMFTLVSAAGIISTHFLYRHLLSRFIEFTRIYQIYLENRRNLVTAFIARATTFCRVWRGKKNPDEVSNEMDVTLLPAPSPATSSSSETTAISLPELVTRSMTDSESRIHRISTLLTLLRTRIIAPTKYMDNSLDALLNGDDEDNNTKSSSHSHSPSTTTTSTVSLLRSSINSLSSQVTQQTYFSPSFSSFYYNAANNNNSIANSKTSGGGGDDDESASDKLHAAMSDLRDEIRGLKGVLLSRKNFPSATFYK